METERSSRKKNKLGDTFMIHTVNELTSDSHKQEGLGFLFCHRKPTAFKAANRSLVIFPSEPWLE